LTPLKDSLPCHPFVKNWANQAAVNEKKENFLKEREVVKISHGQENPFGIKFEKSKLVAF